MTRPRVDTLTARVLQVLVDEGVHSLVSTWYVARELGEDPRRVGNVLSRMSADVGGYPLRRWCWLRGPRRGQRRRCYRVTTGIYGHAMRRGILVSAPRVEDPADGDAIDSADFTVER